MTPKLGRLPRSYDPAIPHLSALRMLACREHVTNPAPNWFTHIKDLNGFGQMLNNEYGCCVEAGSYHAIQVLSSVMNTDGLEITEPDACVLKAYEEVTGFDPANPSSDQGTDMQTYLKHWLNTGIPTGPTAETRHKCDAFVEIDPRNHGDIKEVIAGAGFVYLGFNVPNYLMAEGDVPQVWDYPSAGDGTIVGGHCVIAARADDSGVWVVSWGSVYHMTWAFWDRFTDEAYAIIDPDWANLQGTPLGIPLHVLIAQMRGLAAPAP